MSLYTLEKAIDNAGTFDLRGDNPSIPEDRRFCKSSILSLRENQHQTSGNFTWLLECWRPSHCIIKDQTSTNSRTFDLLPDDDRWLSVARNSLALVNLKSISARTLVLPYNRDTVSYTFLPLFIGRSGAFFVTSMLSGCGFFIAKPDNSNCNVIVLHANVYCRDVVNDNIDYHHLQAMAVLERVHGMNDQCRYKLNIRWAPDHHKPVIDKTFEEYHYEKEVQYYRMDRLHFIYAYNFGGFKDKWMFCIKTVGLSRVKTCLYI